MRESVRKLHLLPLGVLICTTLTMAAERERSPYLNSSCSEDQDDWNRDNVGRAIRDWIDSIRVSFTQVPF